MKRLGFIGLLLLSGCGYQGSYRYECQDPEHWKDAECNPPICRVDGMCTETLLGFNPFEEEAPASTSAPKTDTTQTTEGIVQP